MVGEWTTFSKAHGLITNYVTAVALARDAVWIGTAKAWGATKITAGSFGGKGTGSRAISYRLRCRRREDWVGTRTGLCWYDVERDKWYIHKALGNHWVSCIALDADSIWVGTDRGVFNCPRETAPRNTTPKPTDSNRVTRISVDGELVWIGTQKGLAQFDKRDSRWRNFTTAEGLPNNNVRAISVVDDTVWVGTPRGLGKYSKASKSWQQFDLTRPGAVMGHENPRHHR